MAEYQLRPFSYFYVLLLTMLLEAAFFSFYGISRHYNYLTSINDLGHMDQAVWGILHGHPFLNTDVFNTAVSRLGIHFDPVLALFAPLYLVSSNAIWLILAQAFFLPLTGLPIYFLAQHITKSEQAALFWAIACIFSPFMLSAATWDFHPVSLAVPFIAMAYLALEQRKFRLLLLTCGFIILCKEHFGLLVIGFSVLWFLKHRNIKESFTLLLLGAGSFLLIMKVLFPAFSFTGQHLMLSSGLDHMSRYSWLGNSLEAIFKTIVTKPLETSHFVLVSMNGWLYLSILLAPLLFLPVLGFLYLLPGAADLLANLLSSTSLPRSLFSYHSVTLVPVLIVAAIFGSYRVSRVFGRAAPELQAFVVMAVTLVLSWAFFPFFSLPGSTGFWAPKRVIAYHDAQLNDVRELISSEMSVTAQANIGAHFSQRSEIYRYPEMVGEVDVVILRLESPTSLTRGRDIASLAHHLQMDPSEYLDSIRTLLMHSSYKHFVWMDPWLIFTKDGQPSEEIGDIMQKIDGLEISWEVRENPPKTQAQRL